MGKKANISKIKGILVLKGIFSETKYAICAKFQFSSIMHYSKDREVVLPPQPPPSSRSKKAHPNYG